MGLMNNTLAIDLTMQPKLPDDTERDTLPATCMIIRWARATSFEPVRPRDAITQSRPMARWMSYVSETSRTSRCCGEEGVGLFFRTKPTFPQYGT